MEAPKQLSIFFFPFNTASHMFPMVEIARLMAAHGGVVAHIVTTHRNALLFEKTVDLDNQQHGSQIIIHKLNFPSQQVGLPEGVESYNSTTSHDMNGKVFMGSMLLQQPMEQLIRHYRPDCIVSDMFFPWTVDVAHDLGIPRLHLNPTGFFPVCVSHSLKTYTPHENIRSDNELFDVPNLPHSIRMKRTQLPNDLMNKSDQFGLLLEKMEEAEGRSYGTIMNSFLDLEPDYIKYLKEIKGGKIWIFSPWSLFCKKSITNRNVIDKEQYECIEWLDSQEPDSVLYVSFGSMVRFSAEQMKEIAMALEGSGKRFIWVCRPPGDDSEWLPGGFEERTRKRNTGFLVKGWAPQARILEHPSIMGFMNHCGWSSVIEAVSAGVALITWPLFAEHFYNERLVVDVLKIGVEVGSENWNDGFIITGPMVRKEKIEKAVCRFMSGSTDIEEMKQRAKELKRMADSAVEEGGSSYLELMDLISELRAKANTE